MASSSFPPSLRWPWGVWSSHHQYYHSGPINPHYMYPVFHCHHQVLHLSKDVFLTSLGLPHLMLACPLLSQAPKLHAKLLPLSLPACGTWIPYSPLSSATSLYQASTIAPLCGCLPHATWVLTPSSRPLWAMSCLPYCVLMCSAELPPLPHPMKTHPYPAQPISWLLDWIILKEGKESRKLFMHFSLCKILISLLFHCLFPILNLAHSLVYYQDLEQFLLCNAYSKILHWMNKWVNEWTMNTWRPKVCSFPAPPINPNTLKISFVFWTHLTFDVEFTHGNPVIVLGFLLDLTWHLGKFIFRSL